MQIDIWLDFVCPWCYLSEHALYALVAEGLLDEASLRFRAYRLDPEAEADHSRQYYRRYAEMMGITEAQAERHHQRLVDAGRAEGIDYAFARILYAPTTRALRLMLALQSAAQEAAEADSAEAWRGAVGRYVLAVYRGYFCEGAYIDDADWLAAVAAEASPMAVDEARAACDDAAWDQLLEPDEAEIVGRGMEYIPYLLFPDGSHIEGELDRDALRRVLRVRLAQTRDEGGEDERSL